MEHYGSGLLDPALWLAIGGGLGIGLLIGLERERNPAGKAGVRTFALVSLLGTLAALLGVYVDTAWLLPAGLLAVTGMLVVAYARVAPTEDPGTTTVAAAGVAYLLGALAGLGEATLAAALAIVVTALLYFKPELESWSAALKREEQVSLLQFLVITFIVLPILPDRTYGPYGVLNPREIWLMVVLIAGVGVASYMAMRVAGERHGMLLTGLLGGLVSSTATTALYARRSNESPAMSQVALVVVSLANLVVLVRVAVLAAVVAPGVLPRLAPVARRGARRRPRGRRVPAAPSAARHAARAAAGAQPGRDRHGGALRRALRLRAAGRGLAAGPDRQPRPVRRHRALGRGGRGPGRAVGAQPVRRRPRRGRHRRGGDRHRAAGQHAVQAGTARLVRPAASRCARCCRSARRSPAAPPAFC